MDDILQNIIEIGNKVGDKKGKRFCGAITKRIEYIKNIPKISRPKVVCIEWLNPLFTAGHWIPQMVEMAGGANGISSTGDKSRKMEIGEIVKFDPDILVLMPCGFE